MFVLYVFILQLLNTYITSGRTSTINSKTDDRFILLFSICFEKFQRDNHNQSERITFIARKVVDMIFV